MRTSILRNAGVRATIAVAGPVTDSPHRFVRVSYWAALTMLTQGWTVLDAPSMPARLVMLPEEGHGYRTRESLLHMLWEQNEWLKRWVSPGPEAAERATTD